MQRDQDMGPQRDSYSTSTGVKAGLTISDSGRAGQFLRIHTYITPS